MKKDGREIYWSCGESDRPYHESVDAALEEFVKEFKLDNLRFADHMPAGVEIIGYVVPDISPGEQDSTWAYDEAVHETRDIDAWLDEHYPGWYRASKQTTDNVERLRAQQQFGDNLLSAGLTPFDLCSWTTLLCLLDATDKLNGDLDVWHSVRSSIEEAALRKAALLDAEKNTDFHISTLESYGVR